MDNLVKIENNKVVVSSRDIAKSFNKEHKNVTREIGKLIGSKVSVSDMFVLNEYKDSMNRSQYEYLLNRDGFTLLAMGFTGEKALEWKIKYINAFNEMEKNLAQGSSNILERFHQFNGLVIDELNGVNARIDKLEDETIVNSRQVKKIKDKANAKAVMVLGGKDSICYQDSSIRAVVYANLWNDYKDYLGITSYSDTRKIDYDKGIDFISKWQPNGRTMRILEGVIEYE